MHFNFKCTFLQTRLQINYMWNYTKFACATTDNVNLTQVVEMFRGRAVSIRKVKYKPCS